jgi:N-acyl-D-aspartate/D-glutamate deacylase
MGFSDAGAHLRQMAHYNFPLRLLKLVRDAERAGKPFMSVGRAVHRLTGEIGQWLGLDAGHLAVVKLADVFDVDHDALDARLDDYCEAAIAGYGDDSFRRLVRRNDDAVPAVFIGGVRAVTDGRPAPALGRDKLGRLLRASTTAPNSTNSTTTTPQTPLALAA